jgi:hypothetical protein
VALLKIERRVGQDRRNAERRWRVRRSGEDRRQVAAP